MGRRQTVQTQIRRHMNVASDQGLHCLITEFSIGNLNKNVIIPPSTPYNQNGLVQLIRLGMSIRLKWVKNENFIYLDTICL